MKNAIATAAFIFRFWWCYAPHSSAPHGLRRWGLISAPCVCGCFNFSLSAAAAPLRRQLAVSLQRLVYSRPDFSPRYARKFDIGGGRRGVGGGGGGGLANYTKLFFCIIRFGRGNFWDTWQKLAVIKNHAYNSFLAIYLNKYVVQYT